MTIDSISTYKIKRRYYDNKKMSRGCEMVKADGSVCGYNEHPSALELDHLDPSQKYTTKSGKRKNPGELVNYSQAVVDYEFSICRILCANCHMVYTHTVQRTPVLSEADAKVIDMHTKRKVA